MKAQVVEVMRNDLQDPTRVSVNFNVMIEGPPPGHPAMLRALALALLLEADERETDDDQGAVDVSHHVHCGKCGGVAVLAPDKGAWRCTSCRAEASHLEPAVKYREWKGGVHP